MDCRHLLLLVMPALLTLPGCARDLELAQYQARVIPADDADQVLLAATRILKREFGRVHVSQEGRVLETEPVEFQTSRESGTARDLYRGGSSMRRSARLSVGRRGQEVIARVRVDIERQDTARALAMAPSEGWRGDATAYTPIERDAATTKRQNTVWTKVRRDRQLERKLLNELSDEFAPPVMEPPGDQAAYEQTVYPGAGGQP
jgi:hypothetical protein